MYILWVEIWFIFAPFLCFIYVFYLSCLPLSLWYSENCILWIWFFIVVNFLLHNLYNCLQKTLVLFWQGLLSERIMDIFFFLFFFSWCWKKNLNDICAQICYIFRAITIQKLMIMRSWKCQTTRLKVIIIIFNIYFLFIFIFINIFTECWFHTSCSLNLWG